MAAQPVIAAISADVSQVRDFHRLSFDWQQPTYITAGVDGQILIINAERPMGEAARVALKKLGKLASSHTLSRDGKTLTIRLNGSFRARSFLSGNQSGVDIIPSASVKSASKIIKPAPQKIVKKDAVTKKDITWMLTQQPVREVTEEKQPVIQLAQAAPAIQSPPQPTSAAKPKPKPAPAPPVAPEPKAKPESIEVKEPKPEAAKPVTEPATPEPESQPKPEPAPDIKPEAAQDDKPGAQAEATAAAPASEPMNAQDEQQVAEIENAAEDVVPAAPITAEATAEAATEATVETAEPVSAIADKDVAEMTGDIQPPSMLSMPVAGNADDDISAAEQSAEEAADALRQIEKPDPADAKPISLSRDEGEDDDVIPTLRIRAKLDQNLLRLRFPWQKRTAVASYVRNNTAWIVFNHPSNLDLSEVNSLLRAGVTIKQIPNDDATILYIPISSGAGMKMESVAGTFRWEATIIPGHRVSASPVKVETRAAKGTKPHVFLPLIDVGKLVRLKDPAIGDELDILPVYADNQGISPARNFPEFSLLESVQGMTLLRRSDRTTVEMVRNGLRISTQRGAVLSENLPLPEDVVIEEGEGNVLLPYKKWKVADNRSSANEIALIRSKIGRGLARNQVESYLRLAEVHLAYGEAVEALGYLNNIKRMSPSFYIAERLSAMQGAANFLLQRYADAARNFRVPELQAYPEVKFWQVMLSELLGKPTREFNYEANYEPHIQYYPPILRQRIGIFAADRYIANKDHNAAVKIFDRLNEQKLINEVADYINYLMGRIAVDNDKAEEGYKIWQKIVDGPATEFVKVRAEYGLVLEKYRRDEIETTEAINRLERLAIRWRGDNLELAVLSTLSAIYEKQRDWPSAIRIWRSMNEAFPNTSQAVEASRKMDSAFIAMFDRNETGNASRLDLMFLYNEYRELIPDDEVGDRIVEKLAQLMIDMDMLKQAQEMLESRMRYRFEHVDRSKVGAKLAEVYMLDKKPQKALEALQLSVFGILPEPLLKRRNYLNAEALLMLKRYNDLFLLLEDDKSADANYFRLKAHWQAKEWKKLAAAGEAILKNRQAAGSALSDIERDSLIKLALAYIAMGEQEQINYLRDYFTPLMKNEPEEGLFTFLTKPYGRLTPDNFDAVVETLDQAHDFIASEYGTKDIPAEPAQEG